MTRKILFLLVCLASYTLGTFAQQPKTKNLVIITFDGYRWKELFDGADSVNLFGKKFNSQDSTWRIKKYWAKTNTERRNKLMPFFWSKIAKDGQVYGNRNYGNFVNVTNRYWFSYPGYNEIFTGYADTLINSNAHPANHNINVLEFLHQRPEFKGKVATFSSWDAFPKILNEQRSGFPVNSGYENVTGTLTETQKLINEMQWWLPKDYGMGERHDAITYALAKEHVKIHHPRVLQISFIETDALAHSGKYDYYLDAAHYNDQMISDLWNLMQNDPFYKDNTTFIITEDHGRGYEDSWQHHYYSVPHSNEIFFAIIGPDTKPLGEVKEKGQLYQNQFAQTMASLLGVKFENGKTIGQPIKQVQTKN
jgi:hypothetical protein